MSRRPVLVAVAVAAAVAMLGGAMTDVGPWYRGLEKSSLNPPDWLFAPAWTVIYALCVWAAVEAWHGTRTSRERAWLVSLFFVNAVLNVLWSFAFFTLKRPDWALAEVVTLWLSVLGLVVFLRTLSGRASLLLLPYLAWVAFAAFLNVRVVQLNGAFG